MTILRIGLLDLVIQIYTRQFNIVFQASLDLLQESVFFTVT